MAPKHAKTVGAGVLGNLNYDDDTQVWLLKLGQYLGVYELSSADAARIDIVRQRNSEAVTAIEQILASHRLSHSVPAGWNLTPPETTNQILVLLHAVRSYGGPSYAALVLIDECACILRQEPLICTSLGESEEFVGFAKNRMNHINTVAPNLSLATDSLWEILCSRTSKELGTSRVQELLGTAGVQVLLRELLKPLVILIVSADPRDATRLRVAEERRELDAALRATRFRDSFTIRDIPSCRVRDIARALDEYSPEILLFTGHGSSSGLCFEDDSGRLNIVETSSLARLLQDLDDLNLVILNSCYSQDQAQCIADAVVHVIGMEGMITDTNAIDFSREFFTALGYGRTFEESFERAIAAVGLNSSSTLKAHFLKAHSSGPSDQHSGPLPSPAVSKNLTRDPININSWYYFAAILVVMSGMLFYMFEVR